MPPTRRQRDESTPTRRSVRQRTTTQQQQVNQQQQVQIEEPRPLELPPAEPVRQDATLEEMLRYPEVIFNNFRPYREYIHFQNGWTDDVNRATQHMIQEIRNEVLAHPEKEQQITNLLRSYIQKLREFKILHRQQRHASRENQRIIDATRINRNGRNLADPSSRARGLRNSARFFFDQADLLYHNAEEQCEQLEDRITIALYGEQGARERNQMAQGAYFNDEYDSGSDGYDSDSPLPPGPLPAQPVPALPALPRGFKQSELPSVNIAEQCNGETKSPINLDHLESDKTVIMSDGKCYTFDEIATLYRINHRNFKSPFTNAKYTDNDINIARTLIEKGYGKIEGGRKSKKARKTRKTLEKRGKRKTTKRIK
jgi:hypothetical protein